MAVLIATNLRKEIAGSALFEGVSFKVERRDRLALAGPNGAGTTTLLRALLGEVSLEAGELAWEKGARVALHDQRPPAGSRRPLRDYVLAGTPDLAEVEGELRALAAAMAGGAHDARTLARYASAQSRLEHAGGYDWRDRATSVVRGLGFTDADLDRPLDSFSGGELTRASLARALASQPDLLLLDEPTNHLDIESIEWLEELLRTIDAGVILVAHDRWFLEAVTTAVLQLEGGRSVFFPGEWHVWRREQAARAQHAVRTADRQAEELARLERFVERFRYKASKARQAQSKLKQIERIKRPTASGVHGGPPSRRVLGFEFLKPKRSGGERRRLALAHVVASGANLLLLDEPTNHLDLESRESLEAALEAFPGAVLLVTHDRALLDAVSGRLLAIEGVELVSYAGGWAEDQDRPELEPRP